jgi:DNA repair protein RecN (Recombination protein N)
MLINLHINNVLLIEHSNINFAPNLSILTGETGAGKSIILDSLLFALGDRANSKLIRQGESSASVAAEFSIENNDTAHRILKELDITIGDSLILRRTINLEGKSKNYINDTPVSIAALKKLSEKLIEIHSQHEQKFLLDSSSHIEIIDSYGNLENDKNEVSKNYDAYKQTAAFLANLKTEINNIEKEQEYLSYVVDELTKLNVQIGEEQQLSDKRILLMNKEKLIDIINSALSELNGRNNSSNNISNVQRSLGRNNNFTNISFSTVIDYLERASIEINSAINNLEEIARSFTEDEDQLEDVESRLFTLKAIARKYNIAADNLPGFLEDTKQKLVLIHNQGNDIDQAKKQLELSFEKYFASASKISEKRKEIAIKLESDISLELTKLKMENTKFKVDIEKLAEGDFTRNGIDKISFLISPNPGLPLAPLAKVASGGELSRFMLAAKVVLAKISEVSTLVFDEIDTGLSGAVADAVGARLALLAKTTQVIAITHQPQIASKGDLHIHVAKNQDKNSTKTSVTILSSHERTEEIARMLAGETVTDAARAAAKQLMLIE